MLLGVEHRHDWLCSGLRHHQIGAGLTAQRLRNQEATKLIGFGDSRGQPDGRELRCQHKQAGQAKRQQVAALGCDQRMQFIEDNPPERAEQVRCIGAREQQCQLLRRREQNIGRIAALALTLRRGRIACARFHPHRQPHLLHRNLQIPRNVDGKSFQR